MNLAWLKENMKLVGCVISGILLVLSLITGILTFDSRYAKPGDVQALERKVVQNLEQFQEQQERKFLEQRYQTLTDQLMTQKQLMRKYPGDKEIKEDYEQIKEEREKVKEKLSR